jgi:hypothetical protein
MSGLTDELRLARFQAEELVLHAGGPHAVLDRLDDGADLPVDTRELALVLGVIAFATGIEAVAVLPLAPMGRSDAVSMSSTRAAALQLVCPMPELDHEPQHLAPLFCVPSLGKLGMASPGGISEHSDVIHCPQPSQILEDRSLTDVRV